MLAIHGSNPTDLREKIRPDVMIVVQEQRAHVNSRAYSDTTGNPLATSVGNRPRKV